MKQNQLKSLKKDIKSFLKKDIYGLEKKVLRNGWNASLNDLEKKKRKSKIFRILDSSDTKKIWRNGFKFD